MSTGNRIRSRRIELGMTQEELANRLGYASKSSVNKAEKDINQLGISLVEKYAIALDCDPAYLVGWQNEVRKDHSKERARILSAYAKTFEEMQKKLDALDSPIRLPSEGLKVLSVVKASTGRKVHKPLRKRDDHAE